MFVNRGIYTDKGWTAVQHDTAHRGRSMHRRRSTQDVWELYGPDDWTQAHDLAQAESRRNWLNCSDSGSSKPSNTTSCRSTTVPSSDSIPTWPVVRS